MDLIHALAFLFYASSAVVGFTPVGKTTSCERIGHSFIRESVASQKGTIFPKSIPLTGNGIRSSNVLETDLISSEELDAIRDSPIFLDSAKIVEEGAGNGSTLPAETLINLAKRYLVKTEGVNLAPELLSEDFVFEGPVVGPFGKDQFVKAIGQVDFRAGFPDFRSQFYNFNVDPFDPERVWYFGKGEGTNTGPFPTTDLPATYQKVVNPPQVCSLTIDSSTGRIKRYTIGYVADRTVGNTGGLGGLYGILYAIGRPLPFPEAQPWRPSLPYAIFQSLGGLINSIQEQLKR